jgi:hypothetical protein
LSIYPVPVTARNSAAATTTNISAADAIAAAYAFFLLLRPAQLQLLLCTSAHARFMSATFMHGSPSSRMFDPLATLADWLIGAAAVRRIKAKRHPRRQFVYLATEAGVMEQAASCAHGFKRAFLKMWPAESGA